MSFNGIQRYVTRIDLRTMRPSEKQKYVDHIRREYVSEQITWEPADATEIWIKESRGGELFREFVARLLQKQALVEQRENEPEPTLAHPLIQALASVNDEARRVVWRLGSNIEYDNGPHDSGSEIDKA
jgi:hypothetical protein